LAHIYLDHELLGIRPEVDRRQENEANALVTEWGFGAERDAFLVS